MTIRTRLLSLLMPPLVAFIAAISVLYYYSWHKNIVHSYQTRLQSVVAGCAALLDEWNWLELSGSGCRENAAYTMAFNRISEQLALKRLFALPQGEALKKELDLNFKNIDTKALFADKKTIVSNLYASSDKKSILLSAIAPVLNHEGLTAAYVVGEIDASAIHKKLDETFFFIFAEALITLAFVAASVYFVAYRISKPVQKLKNSALAIAAGEYGRSIDLKGPKEIVELAGTLNTMSECLQEHMSKLNEKALKLQQTHSEHDCALFMQKKMWQESRQKIQGVPLLLSSLDLQAGSVQGIALHSFSKTKDHLTLYIVEAKKPGFSGVYQLLKGLPPYPVEAHCLPFPYLALHFSFQNMSLSFQSKDMPPPLVWSTHKAELFPLEAPIALQPGDLIFAFNSGLTDWLCENAQLKNWLCRTLKHFAQDGMENCLHLLEKELLFLKRKNPPAKDIHLLGIQTLNS